MTLSYPEITLLVTHFNRSSSLLRLLESLEVLGLQFGEIVVSDDGSKEPHAQKLDELEERFGITLLKTEKNGGLGANLNRGSRAVKTPYTLYVQEDFVPQAEFVEALDTAFSFLKRNLTIDIARFYAYFKYPFLTPMEKGFSLMEFNPNFSGYKKFYMYSDHPHLRRTNFEEKFGPYKEGLSGDMTEYDMMISFLAKRGKAIYYDNFQNLFEQCNSKDEPSTMRRNFLRESNNVFIASVRHLYRIIKMNLDYRLAAKNIGLQIK
ncbi:glycosyltransferase [Marinilongibacter aquaticus]|uniref:glycosyltransferase family 2 protein n=1 Tax=Marinilongibacter aquaticus TaxID=2975157 RepID=UPI0021BD177D|nr:glycosyltransferase [Marinilongibacter aquaticus]UBM60722.1 glycosyltransferase [Marinilongibacter aquaticus]